MQPGTIQLFKKQNTMLQKIKKKNNNVLFVRPFMFK